ncbi:MAG TPA: LysE family transporter [Candidatus Pacearchaeota archaeon]|nr:LysE family transporter [Candidatus Pacearchaeota archaeon]HPR79931.1 LysE family transporter [Candidatus Pacearchaeota archaeon]
MELIIQIFSVLILGIIGGSVPGPIMAAAFTESIRRGFAKSLLVILRAFIAESIVAIFILTLFFSFSIPQSIFYAISFAGAIMLFYLALQVWKINKIGEGEGEIFSFWKILILTILNGSFWIFWITICVPQAFLLKEQIPQGHILFLLLFELGWIIATVSWTFIFSRFRNFLTKERVIPIVFKIFSLILAYFAISLLIEGFKFFV